jgi:translation initiation factor IF-3
VAFRRRRWRDVRPDEDRVRVNRAIRSPEVRVVNEDGQQLGVMPAHAALDIAHRIGLDLVEISANADPPVCKIMDYGRFKFESKKKAGSQKKTQHQSQLKEIKLRPRIDEHDLNFKLNNARKFLIAGDKVKCTVMFRGREIVHQHLGRELLDQVGQRLGDIANAEGSPDMEGRALSLTYSPNRQAIDKLRAEQKRQEAREAAQLAAQQAAEGATKETAQSKDEPQPGAAPEPQEQV